MATSTSHRIGIWVITIVLIIGTIVSFIGLVFANDQSLEEAKKNDEINAKIQKVIQEYQQQVEAVSAKYFPVFSTYSTSPAAFDPASITSLTTKDLAEGTGEVITAETLFGAYYIGWTPDGNVFDQSISEDKTTLKPVFKIDGQEAQVITGWKEGLIGMKVGGVRELLIPAEKAYGEAGDGDKIKPNTPLKFIVMAISSADIIPEPDINSILNK